MKHNHSASYRRLPGHTAFCSLRRSAIAVAMLFSLAIGLRAQALLPAPWPSNWSGCSTGPSSDALQILHTYDSLYPCQTVDAALRLTLGGGYTSPIFGQLGVVDSLHDPYYLPLPSEWFSAFAPIDATVLRSSEGDLVLSATTFSGPPTHGSPPLTASIRFGTTADTQSSNAEHPADVERAEILGNGNFGIDLPPNPSTKLGTPLDQIQIGGGAVPFPGNTWVTPGLTIYGGNQLENTPRPAPDTGFYPDDWRYIAFNSWVDHTDPTSARYHRSQPTSSSVINFAETNGGLLNFTCSPYSSTRGLNDFSKATTMELTGNGGLALWFMDTTANPYHHLFDVYLPGQLPYGVTRNTSGLSYFHTPLYIGIDTPGHPLADFTNFANMHPDIGDGLTWMLAVNGPALFKEAFVNENDWPDYVFLPDYHLMTIEEFGNYMERNHHLPEIPPAAQMQAIPLGKTESAMTKQMEEMALYIVQLNKDVEALKTEVQELKNQKEK